MSEVVLIVVFNHKYDKNLLKLEKLYKGRFSNIRYIIPFYSGAREDVIPVYENSYYFQGYLAQAYNAVFKKQYEHYIFIADDLILNPVVNEHNYKDHFKVDQNSSFLPYYIQLSEAGSWPRVREAFDFSMEQGGLEITNELPAYEQAYKVFSEQGFTLKELTFRQIYNSCPMPNNMLSTRAFLIWLYWRSKHYLKRTKFHLSYPLVGGYSDIVVISSGSMEQFCHICGVFAAADLHVEVAIPTAITLSSNRVVTERDLDLQGKPLWSEKDLKTLDQFQRNLSLLLKDFPSENLYLHPIKLSRWEFDNK